MQKQNRVAAGVRLFLAGIACHVHARLFGHMARSGLIAFDVSPEQLAAELKRVTGEVKQLADDAIKQAKTAGDMVPALKEQADKLLTEQGNIKTQLEAIEQKLAKKAEPEDPEDGGELAKALQAKAGDLAGFMKQRSMGSVVSVPVSRKALTNTGTTGAALSYPGQGILAQPLQPLLRRLTVRDLLAQGRTSKSVIWYQRETGYTNNAAVVSEGSLKPKSELTFELVTENVRTIAHLFDISLQMLDDVPFIQSYIESRGRYGLARAEETQLLTGSGTGQNLEGIYTAATQYVQPSGVEINAAMEQDIDKLRLALLQVELADAFASGIVLHPTNWANIELLKDSTGQYLFTNPQTTTQPRLWGRNIVTTQAMTLGRFLVGDFAAHAQIFDRQDANVQISFENKDNFERNMATLRIEERLALAIFRPEAFVKGTLESAS